MRTRRMWLAVAKIRIDGRGNGRNVDNKNNAPA